MDTVAATSPQEGLFTRSTRLVKPQENYVVGILLLLVVVFLWTASNFVTQALFEGGYQKPFLLTYLCTSSFVVYLLPSLIRKGRNVNIRYRIMQIYPGRFNQRGVGYQPLMSGSGSDRQGPDVEEEALLPTDEGLRPLTTRETIDLALRFCYLWFIANWTVNAALRYTSVASTTILASMSGFFTLGIGRLFLVERMTPAKIAAVMMSFGGVLLVSLSDSSPTALPPLSVRSFEISSMPILGDFLALASALFYALYVILLKVRIRSESRIDMRLFFGFVGLFNILTCWPLGVFLHLVGVEPFELPTTKRALGAILLSIFITVTSDYLYVLAMLKTTPLVVTIGLSLTIPLAVLGDFILGKYTAVQVIVGAFLVLVSFIAVGMDDVNNGSQEGPRSEIRVVAGDGWETQSRESLQDEAVLT